MLRMAPVDDYTWPGEHDAFLAKCSEMARTCARLVQIGECAPYRTEFGEHSSRCEVAVEVALPSRSVRGNPAIMVPWINHRGTHSLVELRNAPLGEPLLRMASAKCLVSCFLDFALEPEQLREVQQPLRPSVPDPTELPLQVLATPVASPTVAASKKTGAAASASSTGRAKETRSKTRRVLATSAEPVDLTDSPPPRQPQVPRLVISLAPPAPSALLVTTTSQPVHRESSSSTSSLPAAPAVAASTSAATTSATTTSAATTPRVSPAKTPAESAASTPTRAGPTLRSQSRSPAKTAERPKK